MDGSKSSLLTWIVTSALILGCQPQAQHKVNSDQLLGALAPEPADTSTDTAQMSRYRGQTSFITPEQISRLAFGDAPESAKSSTSSSREIQESDVFKVGPKGSKQLFLLNNYRGLQVVDFTAGPESPVLSARAPAAEGYPDEMYSVDQGKALLALYQDYSDGTAKSSLVTYNVQDSKAPKSIQTIKLDGSIRDSRMAGDILYIAISKQTQNWNGQVEPSAEVVSFRTTAQGIKEVGRQALRLKIGYQETMNILQTTEAGDTRYYLVAVTQENEWAWFDQRAAVEVIDVTDPQGIIRPVFTTSIKGHVTERSQTLIKDRTLIVTSNFRNENAPAMVAVETFLFPEPNSELISQKEAEYRKLHIERELLSTSEADRKTKEEALLADSKLGLRGRFVKTESGLQKVISDSVIVVSDSTGLSASLQDVRVAGDLLYAFWVPVNMVDPLDVFDISQPRLGVKHLSRLQFEGWISRSFPLEYKGRKFIVGLGYITRPVNNEEGRRYPQAMLFEIVKKNGKLAAQEVAQISLVQEALWSSANFNGADKKIELRMDADGKGEILFTLWQYTGRSYSEGGKLLGFDLEAAINGDVVFQEGPMLSNGAGWMRRMFTNPEINRISSFSDEELAIFPADVMSSPTVKAAAVLELARNVSRLVPMRSQFAQVISRGSSWYSGSEAKTLVRLVPSPDSEKPQATKEVEVKGSVSDVHKVSDDVLLLVTNDYSWEQGTTKEDPWTYKTTTRAYKIQMAASIASATQVIELVRTESSPAFRFMGIGRGYGPQAASMIRTRAGEFILIFGDEVYALNADQTQAQALKLNCELKEGWETSLRYINGQWVMVSKESFQNEKLGHYGSRIRMSRMNLHGKDLTCGAWVNIPGEPLLIKGDLVMTQDRWWEGTQTQVDQVDGQNYEYHQHDYQAGLSAVRIDASGVAILIDSEESKIQNPAPIDTSEQIVWLNQENDNQGWGLSSSEYVLSTAALDKQGFILTQRARVATESSEALTLVTTKDSAYAVKLGKKGIELFKVTGNQTNSLTMTDLETKERGSSVRSVASYLWSNNFEILDGLLLNAAGLSGAQAIKID